jgi:ankyrin repeat protein
MAFQCTACSVKPYNKTWMLRRHERESIPCFKHLFPGEPLPIRYECPECDKFGPQGGARKKDVARHLHLIHEMDKMTAALSVMITRPTNTSRQASTQVDTTAAPDLQQIASSSAHQDQLLQSAMEDVRPNGSEHPVSRPSTGSGTLPTLYPTPCLQMATPPITREGSGEIERTDSHLTSHSHPPIIKRKYSEPGNLSKQCKRLRNRVNLEDPNIPDGIYGTPSDDMFTVMANDIREQESGIDAVRDDRTDSVDPNATEGFPRASSLHPRPTPRDFPMENTASHDTPSTDDSHSRLLEDTPATTTSMLTVESHGIVPDDEVHIQGSRMDALSIIDRDVDTLPSNNGCPRPCLGESSSIDCIPAQSTLSKGVKCQSISSSILEFSLSIRTSPSLFGSHASVSRWRHKPLSSHRSAPGKSLHSNGMAGPLGEPVDEELLQSRMGRAVQKARSFAGLSAKSISSDEYELKMQARAREVQTGLQDKFHKAAAHGDVRALRDLFGNLEYNYNDRNCDGQTPLLWASERGYHRGVKELIAEFPELDADCLDNNGMTAIMHACRRGDYNVTDALLKVSSINLDLQDQDGYTALMMAIRSCNHAGMLVRKLIASVKDRPDYATAAQWSRFFDAQDAAGLTALHWAAKMGLRLTVSALLDTGKVDVHRKAYSGITVAMQAVNDLDLDLVTLLLERKACDPSVTNDAGINILRVAEDRVYLADRELLSIRCFAHCSDEEMTFPLRVKLSTARRILRLVEDYVGLYQTAGCSP